MVERLNGIQEVVGSIPTTSTSSAKGIAVVCMPVTPARRRIMLAAVGVGLPLGLFSLFCQAQQITICPLRALFSIPCPTCGSTRVLSALLRGEWSAAFACNPLATVLAIGSAFYVLLAIILFLVQRKIPVLRASRRGWLSMAGGGLLLALVNWGYLLIHG